MEIAIPHTLDQWNAAGAEYLPGHLGIEFVTVEPQEVVARLTVLKALMAWNGFLHAGAVVTLADTCCGYGTVRSLPDGASGFTTIELKSNFLGSAREGVIRCAAPAPGPHHAGLGRGGAAGRHKADCPVPLHANDPVAEGVSGCRRWGQTPRLAGWAANAVEFQGLISSSSFAPCSNWCNLTSRLSWQDGFAGG